MARETKHTPGKWSASQGYDNMYNQAVMEISSEGTEQFVTIWSGQDYIDHTTESNARLISKAPEMYEMLKRVVRDVDWSWELCDGESGVKFRDEIESLIKSAEG